MTVLFDFFILSLVLLATGAACFLLFDPVLDGRAPEPPVTGVGRFRALIARAVDSRSARLATSTIIAAAFGLLEYTSHRLVMSVRIGAEMHAFWDGAVVAFAGALVSWLLLSGRQSSAG